MLRIITYKLTGHLGYLSHLKSILFSIMVISMLKNYTERESKEALKKLYYFSSKIMMIRDPRVEKGHLFWKFDFVRRPLASSVRALTEDLV